jgi:hypothetical protein
VIRDLHPAIKEDLNQDTTLRMLATTISLQHQSALVGGLQIVVNDYKVEPTIPKLLQSDAVKPINYTVRISAEGGEVEARIVAGIAAPRERETRDDGNAEDFPDPSEAGWYVFCNNRLVLAADQSRQTGWGSVTASYHPQYRRFRGYVFLFARDSSLLPWNTTKTGLDLDSPVYRVVQQRMFTALQAVASVLNRQKAEVQQREEGDRPVTAALESAKEVAVAELEESSLFVVPPPPPPLPQTPSTTVQVNFKVERSRLQRIKELLGTDNLSAIGRHVFDYFYDAEIEE